jgi:hypothetical protein
MTCPMTHPRAILSSTQHYRKVVVEIALLLSSVFILW